MRNITMFMIIAISFAAILSAVYTFSQPRKVAQTEKKQQSLVKSMVTADVEVIQIQDFELLAPKYLHMGDAQIAQRVYDNEKTASSIVLTALTTPAYAGRIALLIAINADCSIASVEVLQSQETPGIGDQYKKNEKAWLKSLQNKDLSNTQWQLKQHGGDIDAWTGATVTPKAIVESIERVLKLCEAHQADLFSNREIVYID